MSKKVIIIIITVIAVIGIGAGVYAITKSDDTEVANSTNQNTQSNAEQTSSVSGTVTSFLTSSDSKECTYSNTADGRQSTGTVYFANQKLRMNYTSTSDGKTTDGSMIISNGTQYIWDNGTKQGFKFAFKTDATAPSSSQSADQAQNIDVSQKYDFKCKNWTVNESYFTPPSDVTIKDFSQLQTP